jgi:hypothetical protein
VSPVAQGPHPGQRRLGRQDLDVVAQLKVDHQRTLALELFGARHALVE